MLQTNARLNSDDFLDHLKRFVNHIQRSEHIDLLHHQCDEDASEDVFKQSNNENVDASTYHMTVRLSILFDKEPWTTVTMEKVLGDGESTR